MRTSTSLTLATASTTSASPTFMQAFVTELLGRTNSSTARTMQVALWGPLPTERLLADGTWVLLLAVATKLGRELKTPADVADVASRADRLVSVGLAIRYKTASLAAAAFERQVVHGLGLAVDIGYRPGTTLSNDAWRELLRGQTTIAKRELRGTPVQGSGALSAFWATPCYLFLADAFKAAREFGDQLRSRFERFEKLNVIHSHVFAKSNQRGYDIIDDTAYIVDETAAHKAIAMLDTSLANKDTGWDGTQAQHLPDVLRLLERQELKLSTLRGIAFQAKTFPKAIFVGTFTMAEEGVRRLILRAALPDAGRLNEEQRYQAELAAVKAATPPENIARTLAMVRRLAPGWTGAEAQCFEELVAYELPHLYRLSDHPLSVESVAETGAVASLDSLHLSPTEALQYALGELPAVDETVRDAQPESRARFLRSEVVDKIDWAALEDSDMDQLIHHGPISSELLLDGLAKASRTVRRAAIGSFLTLNPDHTAEVFRRRVVKLDRELFNEFAGQVPLDHLGRFLKKELARSKAQELLDDKLSAAALLVAFGRLGPVITQALWRTPSLRGALEGLTEMVTDHVLRERLELPPTSATELRTLLGQELWNDFTAAVDSR